MTKIVDGYAQPDVQGTNKKTGKERYVFVEDALSLIENEEAIVLSIRELIRTRLSTIEEIEIRVI